MLSKNNNNPKKKNEFNLGTKITIFYCLINFKTEIYLLKIPNKNSSNLIKSFAGSEVVQPL